MSREIIPGMLGVTLTKRPIKTREPQIGDRTNFKYWTSLKDYISAHDFSRGNSIETDRFYTEQRRRISGLLKKYGAVIEITGVVNKKGKGISVYGSLDEKYPPYVVGEIADDYRFCDEFHDWSSNLLRELDVAEKSYKKTAPKYTVCRSA